MSVFSNLKKRWDDWSGDREMEQAIRRHLSENGYFGNTATLSRIRLSAVQRPGWVQVYVFDVNARQRTEPVDDGPDPEPIYEDLFGVLRDDARGQHTKIRVFDNAADRLELFERYSEGLIQMRGARHAQNTAEST